MKPGDLARVHSDTGWAITWRGPGGSGSVATGTLCLVLEVHPRSIRVLIGEQSVMITRKYLREIDEAR